MTDKEQIKAIIKQYADKGKKMYSEIIDSRGSRYNAGFWDGYECCAKGLLRELEDMQKEPISEEFEKALAEEWQGYVDRGAATVDALEDNTQELAFAKGFYRGANWQKEQFLAKAIDAVVKIDAGGYPYVDRTIELYDYDKDIPLAKRGDKVKILVIKES